jgi:hypothetical protein
MMTVDEIGVVATKVVATKKDAAAEMEQHRARQATQGTTPDERLLW